MVHCHRRRVPDEISREFLAFRLVARQSRGISPFPVGTSVRTANGSDPNGDYDQPAVRRHRPDGGRPTGALLGLGDGLALMDRPMRGIVYQLQRAIRLQSERISSSRRATVRLAQPTCAAISLTVYPSSFKTAIRRTSSSRNASKRRPYSSANSSANSGVGSALAIPSSPAGSSSGPSGLRSASVRTRPPPRFSRRAGAPGP